MVLFQLICNKYHKINCGSETGGFGLEETLKFALILFNFLELYSLSHSTLLFLFAYLEIKPKKV